MSVKDKRLRRFQEARKQPSFHHLVRCFGESAATAQEGPTQGVTSHMNTYVEIRRGESWCSIFMLQCLIAIALSFGAVRADDSSDARVDKAIQSGLAIVQKAAHSYPTHRECFSCHHQTLPLLAMREAEAAGLKFDDDVAKVIEDHTFKSFNSRVEKLNAGKNIGGRANTVSYGLWALELADHEQDETTAAMVQFLLKNQQEDGRWVPPSKRPPLEGSQVAVTVLSAYYMSQFAEDEQRDEVGKALAKARNCLISAELKSQDDYNFRLWGIVLLEDADDEASQKTIAELRDTILAAQRDDGGWSQLPDMKSDAYATGQTLFVLAESGLAKDNAAITVGEKYLLDQQQEDGSWLVETRAKPVQIFFDNGDPHGKSQFISIAATSWATAALARIKRLRSE